MTLGISIPTYSNVEALRRCLHSVTAYVPDALIVVVDDSGTGIVCNALRPDFSHVRWIVHDHNLGFGASANEAVAANPAELVILLNDDVELLCDPTVAINALFTQPDIFAVTFRSLNELNEFREGAKRIVWRFGFPKVLHNERDQRPPRNGIQTSDYAVGGHAAFHRAKFVELDGFDPLFAPFYWEDVDLSARAAQSGWKVVYEAECVVRHAGPSSIRDNQKADYIREITFRNRILYAWRHATPLRRRLLALNLIGQRIFGDRTLRRAYRAAKTRAATHGLSLSSRSTLVTPAGVPFGD